jgi:multisubunit Na+/H+ antiporter MnhG subunit
VEITRHLLTDEDFRRRHSETVKAFTRVRLLTFSVVLVLILRKSVKSLQLVLNEFTTWLTVKPVTASAFSQARYKLNHEAFIELNRKAVVETLYGDGDYQTLWGFRLLAIDGTKLILPETEAVRRDFGTIAYTNGQTGEIQGERPYALASVLYDVLNRVAVEARLDRAEAYEVDLAVAHLEQTCPSDLIVMDRNYPSYRLIAECAQRARHSVIRCSAASFKEARRMLKGEGPDSQIVTLTPCAAQRPEMRRLGLPASVTVRFVRVLLSTGEWEVLVTSLLDEVRYPTVEFRTLYRLRWSIETFYGVLKTRLELENFTGTGAEAIRQDFHATIYLSGLESLLTDSAQAVLNAKETAPPRQVNRVVSFHAIKERAFDLLLSDRDTASLCEQLTALFLTNPIPERKERNPPRRKTSARILLNFHKRQRKHCF